MHKALVIRTLSRYTYFQEQMLLVMRRSLLLYNNMKVYCVNQYNMLTVNNRGFISDWTTDATSTPMFLFENRHYFFSGLAYSPHVYVSGENNHQKRIFSKMLSRVEVSENTSLFCV